MHQQFLNYASLRMASTYLFLPISESLIRLLRIRQLISELWALSIHKTIRLFTNRIWLLQFRRCFKQWERGLSISWSFAEGLKGKTICVPLDSHILTGRTSIVSMHLRVLVYINYNCSTQALEVILVWLWLLLHKVFTVFFSRYVINLNDQNKLKFDCTAWSFANLNSRWTYSIIVCSF